ncbi:hypothetical protein Tco_1320588 [Tanacetum coccineum]
MMILLKNIFNSGKNKDGAGMKILGWMLTEAMKITNHYKILDDLEAQQNVEQVKEHMVDEELDHFLDGNENVYVDEFIKVENDADLVIVNANDKEEESAGDEFELKRRVNSPLSEYLPKESERYLLVLGHLLAGQLISAISQRDLVEISDLGPRKDLSSKYRCPLLFLGDGKNEEDERERMKKVKEAGRSIDLLGFSSLLKIELGG